MTGASLPSGSTTPEEMLRFAVSSGDGFFDAKSCEAACRWAVDEIDRLRRWKEEALPVMHGLQDLGRACGVPLGASITAGAIAEVERLRAALVSVTNVGDRAAALTAQEALDA